MSSMKHQIGENLKLLRTGANLTQQQVADALGISRVNYTRYENNTVNPDFDTLVALVVFLIITEVILR